MHGSWHRYPPGATWRRAPARARLVLEVPGSVAVCFDAPVVELLEVRAERLHAPLAGLGPDLLGAGFNEAEALRRLRDPGRVGWPIGEALLDQRALAGIGNVYRSEVLFVERVDPFARVSDLPDETLQRLLRTARRLLLANIGPGSGVVRVTTAGERMTGGPLWVYRRTGRPCRRCAALIRSRRGGELARMVYWCPRCQGGTG